MVLARSSTLLTTKQLGELREALLAIIQQSECRKVQLCRAIGI